MSSKLNWNCPLAGVGAVASKSNSTAAAVVIARTTLGRFVVAADRGRAMAAGGSASS